MQAILAKDLRAALRSGFFLTIGIATPLALAFVLSLVFGNVSSGSLGISVGVVSGDRGFDAFTARLDEDGVIDRAVLRPGTDPARAIENDDLAAVVIPGADRIEVVASPDRPTSAGIVRSIVTEYARGQDLTRIAQRAGASGATSGPVEIVAGERRGRLDATTTMTAAMVTLFVFIIALLGVSGILEERQHGTLARLLASPIRRGSILAAKTVVSFVLSVVAVTVLVVASTVLMDADWGNPAGLAALIVAVALAATGLTLLVAGFAKTIDSAAGIQSTAAVALALLGGAMIPVPDDGIVGALSSLSPHHWFLEGLESVSGGAAWTEALPATGVLLAFAVVLGVPGTVLMLRRLTP